MKPRPAYRRLGALAALAAASLLFVSSVSHASDAMEARQKEMESKRKEWVKKYEELQARHANLQSQLEQARADYSRGRSTRDLVGPGKAALVAEIDRLEKEFAEADAELEAFPEKARRAGALPGWFRDVGPAAQAAGQAADDDGDTGAGAGADDARRSRSISERRSGQDDTRQSRGLSGRGSRDERKSRRLP